MIGEALRDFLRYLPSRILPAVVAVAAVPALTRLLPPSEYGRYTLALNGANLFVALTSSWITASAIRFMPGYEQERQLGHGLGVLLALFFRVLATAAAVAVMGGLLLAARGILSGEIVALGLLLFVAYAAQDFLLGLLRSRRRVTQFTMLTSIAGSLGYALGVGMAFLIQPSAAAVLGGFLLAVLLVAPFSARLALQGAHPVFPNVRSVEVREILSYGLPGLVSNALTWVTSLSDRYILAAVQGVHAVGIYGASRDLSDKPLALINALFLLAATPIGIRLWERDGEEAARLFVAQLTRYYLLLVVPMAVGISVLAQPLIAFLVDARYHDGYRLVPIVAAGAVFAGLATRYTLGLHFRKRTDLLTYCYLGAGLANVGLNLLLVPRFGYMAAAAANLAGYVFLLVLVWGFSKRLFAWTFPFGAAARVAVSVALMAGVVWVSTHGIARPALQLAVGIPVGIVTYTLAILSVGALEPGERAVLTRFLRITSREGPPSRD